VCHQFLLDFQPQEWASAYTRVYTVCVEWYVSSYHRILNCAHSVLKYRTTVCVSERTNCGQLCDRRLFGNNTESSYCFGLEPHLATELQRLAALVGGV